MTERLESNLMALVLESELPFYLQVAKEAAEDAGGILRRNFNAFKIAVFKSESDVALPDEKFSERVIVERLQTVVTDHRIQVENREAIGPKESDYHWYIDPLDGTSNYHAGIAYFSVSLSLLFQGTPVLGVVYNPITNQLFSASKGGGAFLNDRGIGPGAAKPLMESSISFIRGLPRSELDPIEQRARAIEFALRGYSKRTFTMWAPALDWCLLASGGIDGLVVHENQMESQLCGLLIAQEAGCTVTDHLGNEYRPGMSSLVAGSGSLHAQLLKQL
jgi:myo-inositol-1(or 4)-monophosphatase